MSSRRGFLRVFAAAAVAPVLPGLPERAVDTLEVVAEPKLPLLANQGYNGYSVSQLEHLFWNPNYTPSGVTLDDVREYADWKGVDFEDLCSRISTLADSLTNRPVYEDSLKGGLFGLNSHNTTNLDVLYGETWDHSMEELHRLGYNVGPRGKHATGCPKSWFDSKDHLPVPRDVEYYKELRRKSLTNYYSLCEDGSYPAECQRVIDSEVFFEDEQAVNGSSFEEEYVYDEEAESGEWVTIRKDLTLWSDARIQLEVVPTFGPEFSFVMLRPRLKFGR